MGQVGRWEYASFYRESKHCFWHRDWFWVRYRSYGHYGRCGSNNDPSCDIAAA